MSIRSSRISKRPGNEDLALFHAAMKRFPVNASQHSPIELLDNLVWKYNLKPEQVIRIEVAVNEGVLLHGGKIYRPKEVIEAQFSLRFSLALRLLEGNNDLQHYLDSTMWNDSAILIVGKKIELLSDPTAVGQRRFACQMKIRLSDGQEVSGSLAAPKGSYKNPFTASELQDKFYRLGRSVLDDDRLSRSFTQLKALIDLKTLAQLAPLRRRPAVSNWRVDLWRKEEKVDDGNGSGPGDWKKPIISGRCFRCWQFHE